MKKLLLTAMLLVALAVFCGCQKEEVPQQPKLSNETTWETVEKSTWENIITENIITEQSP